MLVDDLSADVQSLSQARVRHTEKVPAVGDGRDAAPQIETPLAVGEEGVVMILFNNAVTKVGKNKNAAKLWMNWVLSREGQEVWTKQIGGLSARTDIAPPEAAPKSVKMWSAKEKDYISLRDSYTKRWNKIFDFKP